MSYSAGAFCRGIALAALGAVGVFVGGCDSGSKRESLYEGLTGKGWKIQRVELDGNSFSFAEQTVKFEFSSLDDGRMYRLSRIVSGDTSMVEGRVSVPQDNVLTMTGESMSGEFFLVWRFTFEKPDDLSDSVQFQLERATEGSVPAFLGTIGLSGGARSLVIDLVRDSG